MMFRIMGAVAVLAGAVYLGRELAQAGQSVESTVPVGGGTGGVNAPAAQASFDDLELPYMGVGRLAITNDGPLLLDVGGNIGLIGLPIRKDGVEVVTRDGTTRAVRLQSLAQVEASPEESGQLSDHVRRVLERLRELICDLLFAICENGPIDAPETAEACGQWLENGCG